MTDLQVPFFRPQIGAPEINEVVETLRSGWLTSGKRVQLFEKNFAAAVGSGRNRRASALLDARLSACMRAMRGPRRRGSFVIRREQGTPEYRRAGLIRGAWSDTRPARAPRRHRCCKARERLRSVRSLLVLPQRLGDEMLAAGIIPDQIEKELHGGRPCLILTTA